jgi:hypothetical protein
LSVLVRVCTAWVCCAVLLRCANENSDIDVEMADESEDEDGMDIEVEELD